MWPRRWPGRRPSRCTRSAHASRRPPTVGGRCCPTAREFAWSCHCLRDAPRHTAARCRPPAALSRCPCPGREPSGPRDRSTPRPLVGSEPERPRTGWVLGLCGSTVVPSGSAVSRTAPGRGVARRATVSPRAAAEAVLVEDDDRLALQLDPAAVHEVGERLVHRLAGGTDQLGQLLL